MRLLTVVAGLVRVCGRVGVIAAALAVLAAGVACSLASAPRVLPAGTSGAAPAAGPHSAARAGGGGQGQSAGAEIDPAYFSQRHRAVLRPGVHAMTPVKTHVSRLLTKLAARDRAQLIVIAYESGFVTPA
jgi:hypothetical protein